MQLTYSTRDPTTDDLNSLRNDENTLLDFNILSEMTDGMTCSEIIEIVRKAKMLAVGQNTILLMKHFDSVLK